MVFNRRNLDWWCGRGILAFLLAALFFAPLAFGAVDAWALLVVQALAAGIFLLWAARLWLHPRPKILWPPLAWAVLAFLAYAGARYFTADIEYVARLEVLQVLMFAGLFLAVANNLYGQEETMAVSWTLVAVGAGTAGYAVAQLAHHSNRVWNEISPYVGRASGTYISPNDLAGLLAMLLPLALAYLLVGKVGIIARLLLGYAAAAMAAGLAVTFSRGGWIAAAAGILLLLVILLNHRNHRWKAAVLLAVLLAGGGVAVSHCLSKTVGYMRRVAAADTPAGLTVVAGSSESRLAIWGAAARMWRDNPWFGTGPAHFDCRFPEYRPEEIQTRPDRVHNDYLNLLADWGVAGGAIVAAGMGIFVVWLRRSWPHVRRDENAFGTGQSNRFAFFLGAMGGLAALAVHSAMDFNLHIPANALVGVTLLALAASHARHATESVWFRPKLPLKLLFTAGLAVSAGILLVQEFRGIGQCLWLARAAAEPDFSLERAAVLEKAFACEPKNADTAYEIGECYRLQSQNGGDNYAALGQQALDWHGRAIRLNPHDGYGYLRTGMALDWLGRTGESLPFYRQAEARDPNGCFMVANIGWHYVQTGDYAAAREYFVRSLKLDSHHNDIAQNYLGICNERLAAQASGQSQLPLPP